MSTPSAAQSAEPTRKLIDESRVTVLQFTVLGVCFVLNMIDGMDVIAISYAASSIAGEWSIPPQSLGVVFSAALIGMMIGAAFLSPYTDVIGRRNMILVSLVIVSVGMLATAHADSVTMLITLRFVAGIGIGAILASMTSMVSEYAPDRHRNLFVLILHAGYPIGAMITGFVAAEVLPTYGWRPLFTTAGCVSLAAIPMVWFLLPESLDFLTKKRPENALSKINKILKRMGHQRLSELPSVADKVMTTGVAALLGPAYKQRTILLWLSFFTSFATIYFLLSWVVKLAIDSGLALENAIYAGVCLSLGGFAGGISLGAISNRFGLTRVIAVFALLGGTLSIVYGAADISVTPKLILLFVLMFFIQGAFTGLYAVAVRIYPTEIRTTGVGWAAGAGRLGAIFGPIVAGLVLGAGVPISWTFVIFAIPIALMALFVSRIQLAGSN